MTESLVMAQMTSLTDKAEDGPGGGAKIGSLRYITGCYQRASKFLRSATKTTDFAIARRVFVTQLRQTLAKFARLVLQHPDLFPDPELSPHNSQAARLIIDLMRKGGNPYDSAVGPVTASEGCITDELLGMLLAELNVESAAHPSLALDDGNAAAVSAEWRREIFAPVLQMLQNQASADTKRFDSNVMHIPMLYRFVAQPGLVELVTQDPRWALNPKTNGRDSNGRDLQNKTLLGLYMSWSVCPQSDRDPGADHFEAWKGVGTVAPVEAMLRTGLSNYHRSLHDSVLRLLQCKSSREQVMVWLAQAISLNTQRTQDRHWNGAMGIRAPEDPTLSTDGFMVNLSVVMVKLCTVYTAASPLLFDKIEDNYMSREAAHAADASIQPPRVKIDSEPLVLPELVAHGAAPTLSAKPNFTTESLFMTLACLHVGLIPTVRLYVQGYLDSRNRYQQLGARMQGADRAMFEPQFAKMHRDFLCLKTQLHDPNFTLPLLQFYVFVCAWLLHLADPTKRGLPLPAKVSPAFGSVQEHVVADAAEFFDFIAQIVPEHMELLQPEQVKTIAKFYAVFLGNQTYMKQAHLRAKFVHVLWHFTPEQRKKPSPFFNVFVVDPTSEQLMVPALTAYFIDMQDDDSYALAGRRHMVWQIMKNLLATPTHRKTFEKFGASDPFRRYCMLLINDALDLLDTARGHLKTAVGLKAQKEDAAAFALLSQEEQGKLEGELQHESRLARAHCDYGVGAVEALALYSTTVTEPFSVPELATRLAGLVNFNMSELMTRRANPVDGISDADVKEYGLNSTVLIESLARIYVHVAFKLPTFQLAGEPIRKLDAIKIMTASMVAEKSPSGFMMAVAKDERSFNPQVFTQAATLLHDLGKTELSTAFAAVVQVTQVFAEKERSEMEDLGEIPDEYLDPIGADLMRDPVLLPSGSTMDRSVLQQHLLSDPTDPFNRAPLTMEDVVPNDELREEIEAWVMSKRKQ
jgi:ubiquitin conjugation factor E4 B